MASVFPASLLFVIYFLSALVEPSIPGANIFFLVGVATFFFLVGLSSEERDGWVRMVILTGTSSLPEVCQPA